MSFKDYFKERVPLIFIYLFIIFLIAFILIVFNVHYACVIMILFLLIVLGIILFFYKYFQKKNFYDNIYMTIKEIDNKVLSHEMISHVNFLEGKILLDILMETNKYKLDEINKYKFLQEELEEYMEMWVHEIKIPLSVINLIMENNKNKVTNSISEEVSKIDDYIEMILFYARSQMPEKD